MRPEAILVTMVTHVLMLAILTKLTVWMHLSLGIILLWLCALMLGMLHCDWPEVEDLLLIHLLYCLLSILAISIENVGKASGDASLHILDDLNIQDRSKRREILP